jgi:hypothetical protein
MDIAINFRRIKLGYGFIDFLATYGIYLFWFFAINFGLSFIGAALAKKKGYSYGGFLCLGIFTAFWLSLIIVACLTPREGSPYLEQKDREQRYKQQHQNSSQTQTGQSKISMAPGFFACSGCGAKCENEVMYCPSCGKKEPDKPTAW